MRGIQIMKEIVRDRVAAAGIEDTSIVEQPFDYMCRQLSEVNI